MTSESSQSLGKKLHDIAERSYSQLFKNSRLLFENPFRWFDVTFWPLILFFSITLFAAYLQSDVKILSLLVMGLMGWRAVYHPLMEMGTSYMEEYWSNSLTHLFITPIRITEFVIGGVLSAIPKFLVVFVMYFILGTVLYGFYFPDLVLFWIAIGFLFLFGISLGLLMLGFMFYLASESFSMVYTVPDIAVLLSGVYYPVSMLPGPLQALASVFPSTHAFNLIKFTLGLESFEWLPLIGLSIAWLVVSYAFCVAAFHRAKKSGKLVRVA